MKSLLSFCVFALCAGSLHAQNFNFNQQTKWSDAVEKHPVSKEFATSSAVGILDDRTLNIR